MENSETKSDKFAAHGLKKYINMAVNMLIHVEVNDITRSF
jgi:hypothetical protein